MEKDRVTVIFQEHRKHMAVDLDIPLNITANELVIALNAAYDLGIDVSDIKKCYLKSENPIALLRGNKMLAEYGLRNGSVINYTGENTYEKQI